MRFLWHDCTVGFACRGDLSEHHATTQETERSTAEAMQKSVAGLADALDRPPPVLPAAVTQQTAAALNVDVLTGRVRHSPAKGRDMNSILARHGLLQHLYLSKMLPCGETRRICASATFHTLLPCRCVAISCTRSDLGSLYPGRRCCASGPHEDEESRLFYESLPDLRAVVPGVALGSTANHSTFEADTASIDADLELLALSEELPC